MSKERVKLTLINGTTSLISQIVIIILGFVSRTIFIEHLGSEILGLNGAFTNILSILSLSELGIGSAITYCLYKPVYEDDKETIAGIMNLLKKAYIIIGFVVMAGALVLVPFLQFIIKDFTLDIGYIRIIFLLFAFNSSLSYFLGYCRTLFFASQKNYVLTIVDFISKTVVQVLQILIVIKTNNYVLYLLLGIVNSIVSNLIIHRLYKKEYPYLRNNKAKVDNETKKRIIDSVKYLSISSIISVGVFGTDNLLITSIIGVAITGVYSNYTLIIQNLQLLFTSLLNGVVASLGNLIAEGDKEKINKVFNVYDFAYYLVSSFTSISLYMMLNPFINNIWIRKEGYILSMPIVAFLCLNNYLYYKRQPIWQYQNTSGIFKYFVPWSFMELVINLVVSILLAIKYGLIGIFIGTTTAYITSWLGQILIVHKRVLFINSKRYYIRQAKHLLITVCELLIVIILNKAIVINNQFFDFVKITLLCVIVPNALNFALFRKTEEFKYLLSVVSRKKVSD